MREMRETREKAMRVEGNEREREREKKKAWDGVVARTWPVVVVVVLVVAVVVVVIVLIILLFRIQVLLSFRFCQ